LARGGNRTWSKRCDSILRLSENSPEGENEAQDWAMTDIRATRNSHQFHPMPKSRVKIPFERSFTDDEFQRLALGFAPESMDDRWFIFLEGRWLYFARSWTGFCVYKVRIEKRGEVYRIAGAWANRDKRQYGGDETREEAAILSFLIDHLLLG
jgi:hypothetical protein